MAAPARGHAPTPPTSGARSGRNLCSSPAPAVRKAAAAFPRVFLLVSRRPSAAGRATRPAAAASLALRPPSPARTMSSEVARHLVSPRSPAPLPGTPALLPRPLPAAEASRGFPSSPKLSLKRGRFL
ncbi:hypothetical protein J1605_005673 [Eschrichtius robustus]|uniref:Uncharacterized protein n=1 Tax=Eschrichtius robustus TaxID=9764 RepID=A0AB34H865_ESCRO|nr:hypothetical protein J1605_005673 [Eschrichtius robustus]